MIYGGKTNNPVKTYIPEIVSCVNKGTVSSYAGAVGGIAGLIYDWGKVSGTESANCVNEGEVKLLGTSNGYAGGVIGYIHQVDAANTEISCTYSANKGAVSGNKYIGGIVGYSSSTIVDNIANCTNIGSVEGTIETGTKDAKYAGFVGGIAGYTASNIINSKVHAAVKGVYYLNAGMVTGSERVAGTVVATNCQIGGTISIDHDEEDESAKSININGDNYHNYIFGNITGVDWSGTDNYDGCTFLESKPTIQ